MAKKQTRRSISVSRTTYERLKQFCEANNVSMSQFVETRVGDFLGEGSSEQVHLERQERPERPAPTPMAPRPQPAPMAQRMDTGRHSTVVGLPAIQTTTQPKAPQAAPVAQQPVPMTSAAARYAVEPPPPIIKPKQETAAPKPAEKRPDQIFTF